MSLSIFERLFFRSLMMIPAFEVFLRNRLGPFSCRDLSRVSSVDTDMKSVLAERAIGAPVDSKNMPNSEKTTCLLLIMGVDCCLLSDHEWQQGEPSCVVLLAMLRIRQVAMVQLLLSTVFPERVSTVVNATHCES